MKIDPASLRRLDLILWAATAAVACTVFAAPFVSDFRPNWMSFLVPGLACAGLLAGLLFYELKRPDPRISSAFGGTSQIIAFSAVGAPLSYLAASAGLPLQDSLFDATDRVLGFDWHGLFRWMNEFSSLHPIFAFAYNSFTIQAAIVILWLSFSGRLARLRTFILTFMFAALTSILISIFVPAEGVWAHYGLEAADHPAIDPVTRDKHLAIFHGLRDGSFREFTGFGSEGIITFPSMHAAIALIMMLAAWPIPVLRWVFVVINVIMIVSTPVDGGHYFIDVVAGLAIAALGWVAASAVVERVLGGEPRPAILPASDGSPVVPGD